MSNIEVIPCKDCLTPFTYAAEAAEADRRRGRTPPERCAPCRERHRNEYRSLGVSHNDVVQLRSDGSGGLARFIRQRPPKEVRSTERLAIEPMPIEAVIGAADTPGTILHGLLTAPHRVHIVVGPTGSGKSTWLPFRLLTSDQLTARGPIVITQPRIPATEGPAKFVGKMYYGEHVQPVVGPGLAIGYRYGEIGSTMTDAANRLIFMTDGTLLNWIRAGGLRRCSLAIVDEAHERSLNIDKILALLKHKLDDLPHLQVMISSATVNAEAFQRFFGGPGRARIYASEGFTYPILDIFSDETVAHLANDDFARLTQSWPIWTRVDDATRARELLGPACWSHAGVDEFRLRYYPSFETVVYRGVMTEEQRGGLQAPADAAWQRAVSELFEGSQRHRTLGDKVETKLDESIRAKARIKTSRSGPTDARLLRPLMVRAVAEQVLSLVERDEREAIHRITRWETRAKSRTHGWDELASDGWVRLRQPLRVGHILAFLPTSADINACAALVEAELAKRSLDRGNVVLRFFSEAPDKEKHLATTDTRPDDPRPVRKIVIGSNLAETSLTLDGLAYVVDSGLICEEYFDPAQGGKYLPTIIHSQAGCRQRAGRVGRKEPGEAYRLYTREELRGQPTFTTPQIARSSASALILDLVRAGIRPDPLLLSGALMDPPSEQELKRSARELERFAAIDADGDLTHRGAELTKVEGESFTAAQLLLEADRFGVLWEMAIFLAVREIRAVTGPGRKWFGLFGPIEDPVYDDADSEDEGEGEPEGGNGRPASPPGPFDDPYVFANAVLKRQALAEDCLDDLELYLRIWQGWHRTTPESRPAWARAHGVSHEALRKIEATLGLGGSKKGTLRQFWAIEQKGPMSRDVDFSRLDLVRYLYAAGHPDDAYRRPTGGNAFEQVSGRKQKGTLHREAVWATHGSDPVECFGRTVERSCCAATSRPNPKEGPRGGTVLRHLVWLDPAWLTPEPPSFGRTSVALARQFAADADRARSYAGEVPFLTGSALAGFRWPMPDLPRPTPLQAEQWSRQFEGKDLIKARIAHDVHVPTLSARRAVFAQIRRGPLVPVDPDDLKGQFEGTVGREILARVVAKGGIVWATAPSPSPGETPSVPPVVQPISPAAPRKPIGPPVGSIIAATVVRIEDNEGFYGFRAAIADGESGGEEVRVPSDLPGEGLQREAEPGRALNVRITGYSAGMPVGRIQAWADNRPQLTLPDAWPIGTELDAELVGPHRTHAYLRMVRVKRGHNSSVWGAHTGPGAPTELPRRLRVRVTDWVRGGTEPWPRLKATKWLR